MTWEAVIGLEVHVQLGTRSKCFSGSAIRFGEEPNTLCDPIVLGLPGALPVFNSQALEYAIQLGLAVGSTIRKQSRFARKHYFYPDLPKGYQISQFDEPICEGGAVEFVFQGKPHKVQLTRIHLEEDAGKSMHHGSSSLVDLNRAGIPLCEVVSEPDLRSAEEAAEYMRALRQLVRYLGISEGNMEQGHLRCDANVSLRPMGETEFGTRTELKNINSFRFVQNAIEHEIARQERILDNGGTIIQETRLWDADKGTSQSMRTKEEANDYRYFPDPDLPPMVVTAEKIEATKNALPELPMERFHRLHHDHALPVSDALAIVTEQELCNYFDKALKSTDGKDAKQLANWILSELLGELKRDEKSIEECPLAPENLAGLIVLIRNKTISGKIAKTVFSKMYKSGEAPKKIVEREGLVQITDHGAIEEMARAVITANPNQAAAYRGGKEKLLGFFVGQIMKQSRGKANPQMVNELLKKLLSE